MAKVRLKNQRRQPIKLKYKSEKELVQELVNAWKKENDGKAPSEGKLKQFGKQVAKMLEGVPVMIKAAHTVVTEESLLRMPRIENLLQRRDLLRWPIVETAKPSVSKPPKASTGLKPKTR